MPTESTEREERREEDPLQGADIQEILNNNPFEAQAPSEYESWLNAALTMAYHHISGLSREVNLLQQRIEEHEKGHRAVSIAAMELPATDKPEKAN